ncbi:MAG: ribokinase [Lachnospiraceae bacterium]
MKNKIVVIGSMNYDIILKIPRLPKMGETLPVKEAGFSAGGKGANQAVQAAKLGLDTYMVGCVGTDFQGKMLTDTAKGYGVNTDYVRRVEGPSGMGIIDALEDGNVFACIVRGANFEITKEDIDHASSLLKEAKIVILQMEIPMDINLYAISKAKEYGCQILLNAAPAEEIPLEYLKKCDILVVNEVEAGFYLKETINSIEKAETGAKKIAQELGIDCIITLGKDGAVVAENKNITFIPAKKVAAIETTGAGDSFIGGAAYAIMQGMNLTKACEFATCCSAITVCRLGAQPSMPILSEVVWKEGEKENPS